MTEPKRRVLYLPNEAGTWRQSGMRQAFANLREAQLVTDIKVFSYLWRIREGGSRVFEELAEVVRAYQPQIILVQHPAGTGLTRVHWERLRVLADFSLVLHEGDAYDRFRKRLPRELVDTARCADVSFTVGASKQMAYLRRAGSRDVRWVPNVFDPNAFGRTPIQPEKTYDVVLIGNNSRSRIPFWSMPGTRRRAKLVEGLARRHGSRFAVFGRGWKGPHAKGPVAYSEQEAVVQSAWVTANWDHYPREVKSFSDRLPLTLASGSIHVTSSHPGYESIFGLSLGFLRYAPTVRTVLELVQGALDHSTPSERLLLARSGRDYAFEHFREDDMLVTLLNSVGAGITAPSAKSAWSLGAGLLDEM